MSSAASLTCQAADLEHIPVIVPTLSHSNIHKSKKSVRPGGKQAHFTARGCSISWKYLISIYSHLFDAVFSYQTSSAFCCGNFFLLLFCFLGAKFDSLPCKRCNKTDSFTRLISFFFFLSFFKLATADQTTNPI